MPKELHADIAIIGGSTGGCAAALAAAAWICGQLTNQAVPPVPNLNPGYVNRLSHKPKAAIGALKSKRTGKNF